MNNNKLKVVIEGNANGFLTAISRASGAVNKFTGDASKSSKKTSDGFSKVGNFLTATAATVAGSAITSAFGAITNSIDGAIKRVDTMNNFPKVMSSLGVSADKSKIAINRVADGLKGLPTTIDSATLSVQRFVAKNGDVEKSADMFLAVNNAILAGGAPIEIQNAALEQLTQSYSRGKFELEEWKTLTTAIPGQLKQVAQAMGFASSDDLYNGLKEGTVSMDDFMNKIMELNVKGGAGMQSFTEQAKAGTGGIETGMANMQTAITRGVADVITAIGSGNLTEGFEKIGKGFENGLKIISNVVNFVRNNSTVFTVLAVALGSVAAAIGVVTVATAAFNAVMAVNPITWVIAAIVALVAGFILLWNNVEGFRNFFIGAWNAITSVVSGVVGFIVGVFQTIGDIIMGFASSVMGFLAPIIDVFVQIFGFVWSVISNYFTLYVAIVSIYVQTVWSVISVIIGFFVNVFSVVFGIVSGFVSGFMAVFGTIAGWVFANVISPVGNFFAGLWNGVSAGVRGFVNTAMSIIGSIVGWINGAVINPISGFFSSLWNGIVSGVSGMVGRISSAIGGVAGVVKPVVNGLISAVNGVIGTINNVKVPDWVPGIGGSSPNIPKIPMLAKGGVVDRPTLAMVGEAGKEVVMPLENNTGWITDLASKIGDINGGGGRNIVVNNTYNVNDRADAKMVASDLGYLLSQA